MIAVSVEVHNAIGIWFKGAAPQKAKCSPCWITYLFTFEKCPVAEICDIQIRRG